MVTWREVFVLRAQPGFGEQSDVIDSYGEVQLANRDADSLAGTASWLPHDTSQADCRSKPPTYPSHSCVVTFFSTTCSLDSAWLQLNSCLYQRQWRPLGFLIWEQLVPQFRLSLSSSYPISNFPHKAALKRSDWKQDCILFNTSEC